MKIILAKRCDLSLWSVFYGSYESSTYSVVCNY